MKRRDFLKALSAAPLVVAVPALAKLEDKPQLYVFGDGSSEYMGQIDAFERPVLTSSEIALKFEDFSKYHLHPAMEKLAKNIDADILRAFK